MSPLNASEALAVAAQNALFANVPRAVVERALGGAELLELAPGDRVIIEASASGDNGDSGLYILLDGQLLASRTVLGGHAERLSTMSAGEFFGELARTDDGTRSATVAAATPALVARLPGPVTDQLIAQAPEVMRTIAASIARRLRAADQARLQARFDEERLSIVGKAAAMLVHDLRNPLGVVKNSCELIEQGVGEPSVWARRSRSAAAFMLAMVEDLLEFSRGNRVYSSEAFRLYDVIDDIEAFGLAPVEAVGTVLVQRSVGADATIVGDRRALSRAVLNIVKNATDAMATGGSLTFATQLLEDTVRIEVSDTGPGIPSHILPMLFEPFASYGKTGGTGLGMAMAKAAIDAHRGTVTVDTEEGRGTRFTLVIPVGN